MGTRQWTAVVEDQRVVQVIAQNPVLAVDIAVGVIVLVTAPRAEPVPAR